MAKLMEKIARSTGPTGVGAPVRRIEDIRFLCGQSRFVDDISMPNTVYAYVVRSPHAHARIRGIDTAAAFKVSGVLAVLTGEDVIQEKLEGLPCRFFPAPPVGRTGYRPLHPILATDKVRHVGDRVALVVAETLDVAKSGGELVIVDYEPLPSVSLANALAADASKVWDDSGSNLCFQLEHGDRLAVDQAFARAAHATKLSLHYPRASANTIEPRAALAYFDPFDGRYTLCSSTQAPFRVREIISAVLRFPETNLRVLAPDVGGGFGMKGQVYPEEALVVWAAGKLRRPVKWTADRCEGLSSDMHGRDQITEAEIALAADGRVLAMRASISINVGAYLGYSGGVPPVGAGTSFSSVYDVPLIHSVVRATFTNSCPVGPYRGSGKPEATFIIEPLVDKGRREMGMDPISFRRQNLIRPSAMPYQTPSGFVYDSGNFERILDKGLVLADWNGFSTRRADSERCGLRRGIGLAMHCQPAGNQSERMEIRVDRNGSLALHVGTVSTGQGHETMFVQMVSEWLGVPFAQIRVFQGDTDKILFGRGTFAQRSMMTGGSALKVAADEVVKKGRRLAAWMLEASEADVDFERGIFRIKGTDRSVIFAEVAKKSYLGVGLPEEFGVGLDGVGSHSGPCSFPNGCMICEVEIDPLTGKVTVDKLSAVDDVGVAINPITLEGQLHGSVAQGLGQALLEEVLYDPDTGQLLSGSFMDYCMPRADDMPPIVSDLDSVPTKTNLLGVKGGSEAGNVGAPPAIVNAIIDALSPWGITDVPMPAPPERIWRAISGAASLAGGAAETRVRSRRLSD